MNLFLHGIDASETVFLGDSIENDKTPNNISLILANPPFGNKGSAPVNRTFPVKTSDKQLNFVQLIIEKLKKGGKAAVVLPDSCLTDDKAKEIWKYYLEETEEINLHTILKLPRGTFAAYANGIKACVLFFEKGKKTENLWVYDARTNAINMTKKTRQLTVQFFEEFENCFASRQETEKFKTFTFKKIQENDFALDFKWLQDDILLDSDELQPPKDLITYALDNLEGAMINLNEILELLEKK
jgi:type I restriction enzyme M protein